MRPPKPSTPDDRARTDIPSLRRGLTTAGLMAAVGIGGGALAGVGLASWTGQAWLVPALSLGGVFIGLGAAAWMIWRLATWKY